MSSRKENRLNTSPSREFFSKQTFSDFFRIFIDSYRIMYDLISFTPSLSKRVSKYGKVRFLVVCDENLGRSPLFAVAFNEQIAHFGLQDFVEVMSAGTDVVEKGSHLKAEGKAHPVTRKVMNLIPGVDPESHRTTQLDETLVTPNTIIVVLNDVQKIDKRIKRKCYAVLDCSMDDPHDTGEGSLLQRLILLYDKECYLALYLCHLLQSSFERNSLAVFQLHDPMHV